MLKVLLLLLWFTAGYVAGIIVTWKPYERGWQDGHKEGWNDGYDACLNYYCYVEEKVMRERRNKDVSE